MKERIRLFWALLAIMAALGWAGCSSHETAWPAEGVYEGYYFSALEQSDFRPAGSKGEKWWLAGNIGDLASQYAHSKPGGVGGPPQFGPIYLKVHGQLSAPGPNGHLGQYQRELRVQRLIESRPLRPGEATPFQ